jgi:hypothetical protein
VDHHREQEFVDRATELRRELARTSRALHRACEDVACQNERLAANRRQPTLTDHYLTAKRWRALAAQALTSAHTWESRQRETIPALACPRCGYPLPRPTIIDAAERDPLREIHCPSCGEASRISISIHPVSSLADPGGTPDDPDEGVIAPYDPDDETVREFHAIGLRLNRALEQLSGHPRRQVEATLANIDDCINTIRVSRLATEPPGRF